MENSVRTGMSRCGKFQMDENHMSLNTDTVMDYVDENTIGIVGIQGITYTMAA